MINAAPAPIVIVGAGFSGLCVAARLKQAGVRDFVVLEQAAMVGGTWRDTRYPGAACDVESRLYSYSFYPNPDWTRNFAQADEIFEYLQSFAKHFGLESHVRFRKRVTSARYDDETGRYRLKTDAGESLDARVLVVATGGLGNPRNPAISGLDSFDGPLLHSSRWDASFSPRGLSVAVIGTGASAVQIVPEMAPLAARLTVYQRTAPWVLPKPDRLLGPHLRRAYRYVPLLQRGERFFDYARHEALGFAFFLRPGLMRRGERASRGYLATNVADPVLRDKLSPDYHMGCKRILLTSEYYPALSRPNVELVTEPIGKVCPSGIVTTDGVLRKADAVVLATGYRVAERAVPFEISGRSGVRLETAWNASEEAYLGASVFGFPNLFFLLGPNTYLGHNSMILMIEAQARYVVSAVKTMDKLEVQSVEIKALTCARFNVRLQKRLSNTVWASGCRSWYLAPSGKNTTMWPGFTFEFRFRTRRFDVENYDLVVKSKTPRRKRRLWWAVVAFLLMTLTGLGRARGDGPPPAEGAQSYSAYELETIEQQLAGLHAHRDFQPEGKLVEGVDIVPLEVFEPRDPVPGWVNVFHATSRREVIRRELLLFEGEPFRQTLVDETIRNLRRLPQLSAVLVVATRGKTKDGVRVAVITKDVWSLRASWDLVATAGGIELFELAPTETNLLGTQQTVRGEFILQPSTSTFGLGYTIPRIGDSRIAAVAALDVVLNRMTGAVEGSYGSLVAGRPLVSAFTEWSWDSTMSWQDLIVRRYVNAQPSVYLDSATGQRVPYQYGAREFSANYEVTRSFGWDVKQDFTIALNLIKDNYRVASAGQSARAVVDFVHAVVPVADTRVGPSLAYHTYRKRFLRVIDFDTLALQEDVRLGHEFVLSAFPSARPLGSSRDVIRLEADLQYTEAFGDGMARASFASVTEPEVGRPGAPISDASISPAAHVVSPTLGNLGRVVVDGTLLYRWRNYLNQLTTLGGESRLRGLPTSFFVGKDWIAYNLELRSRPIEIVSCQIGGVAFADVGDAFNGFEKLQPVQSIGFGVRALFPQLDRIVFRTDVGFPLKRPIDPTTGAPVPPFQFVISFSQAFSPPSVSPVPVLPTGQ